VCSGAGAVDVTPPSRPTRLVGRPMGGAHEPSATPCGRDHCQGSHQGCLVLQHCFSGQDRYSGWWRARSTVRGRRGGYGFGVSFAGHGVQMVECRWESMEVLRSRWKQGGEERALGFLGERHENSSFLLGITVVLTDLGSRWVKESVHRSWASLGLTHARPTMVDHYWAPVGPSLCWSAGGA
jgi:hypothetical protein